MNVKLKNKCVHAVMKRRIPFINYYRLVVIDVAE